MIDAKWINRRIEHCHRHIETYPEKLNPEKDSCYGGWSKGYWEGRLEALEEIKDMLEEDSENREPFPSGN